MACSLEEEDISTSANLTLIFSQDTVLFDTVLSARTSITKRFRITNPNENAVEFSSIRLGKGRGSDYSLIINGKDDDDLEGEVLFGGDSLLILVEVDIDPQDEGMPYIVKDSIIVDWNGNSAHVKLVAWGQDANFINGQVISTSTWVSGKPYVIRNLAVIDSLETLTVEAGTNILLDNGASLLVYGTLLVKGDTANPVIIRNTRFDANYLEAPGQWGGVLFMETSRNNVIDHAIIENGGIGLGVGYSIFETTNGATLLPENGPSTAQVLIKNTTIRHMLTAGILAFSSEVTAVNTEVYNCGTWLVGNFAGGTYDYQHCTFSNFPSFFVLEDPSFQYSNYLELGDEILVEDLNMKISNSIIWGNNDFELASGFIEESNVILDIDNNIIRDENEIPDNFTSVESNFPGFLNPFAFNYQLDSVAFAIGKARSSDILLDINEQERDDMPDIGAHEYIQK